MCVWQSAANTLPSSLPLTQPGDWGGAYYGANHPMKPHRIVMAHHLVLGYGLQKRMDVFVSVFFCCFRGGRANARASGPLDPPRTRLRRLLREREEREKATSKHKKLTPFFLRPFSSQRPRPLDRAELTQFHTPDYMDFLATSSLPSAAASAAAAAAAPRYNVNDDCPLFDGLWPFVRSYAGASVQGAVRLNHGLADVAINWAGGLHHAKKAEASGFCYVNDLVLAILELLKFHPRVLYIDIDIHHGDGVEEAFYLTDRVMTLSLHRYGDFFFPGTGDLGDVGERRGRGYSVNVPLREGMDDATFLAAFKPVVAKIMETFRPGAVVLQCGADSLAGDRLGCFSLTLEGHAEAVRTVARYGLPMLVTGGGGYTKANVARAWCAETAALAGVRLHSNTPIPDDNDYAEYYAPTHTLGVTAPRGVCEKANSPADVDRIVRSVLERLSRLEGAPGVALAEMPPDAYLPEYGDGDGSDADGDERLGEYGLKHMVVRDQDDDDGYF